MATKSSVIRRKPKERFGVVFKKGYPPYNAGELAGFTLHKVLELCERGVCDPPECLAPLYRQLKAAQKEFEAIGAKHLNGGNVSAPLLEQQSSEPVTGTQFQDHGYENYPAFQEYWYAARSLGCELIARITPLPEDEDKELPDSIRRTVSSDSFENLDSLIDWVIPGNWARIRYTFPKGGQGIMEAEHGTTIRARDELKYNIANEFNAGAIQHVKLGNDRWLIRPSEFYNLACRHPGVSVKRLKALEPASMTEPAEAMPAQTPTQRFKVYDGENGSYCLQATDDKRAKFGPQPRGQTKQQQLLYHLAVAWPNGVEVSILLKALYPNLLETHLNDAESVAKAFKRLCSTVTAMRKKIGAAGLPEDILPTLTRGAVERRERVRLIVDHLTKTGIFNRTDKRCGNVEFNELRDSRVIASAAEE